jgi:hypothetical protein
MLIMWENLILRYSDILGGKASKERFSQADFIVIIHHLQAQLLETS